MKDGTLVAPTADKSQLSVQIVYLFRTASLHAREPTSRTRLFVNLETFAAVSSLRERNQRGLRATAEIDSRSRERERERKLLLFRSLRVTRGLASNDEIFHRIGENIRYLPLENAVSLPQIDRRRCFKFASRVRSTVSVYTNSGVANNRLDA